MTQPLVPDDAHPAAAEPVLLLNRLAAIDGFDVHVALRNVGGQMPSLERVLASFVRTYQAGEPQLLQAPTETAGPRLRALLHTLRGVCATIGAVQVLHELSALDMALQANSPAGQLAHVAGRVHQGLAALARQLQTELEA